MPTNIQPAPFDLTTVADMMTWITVDNQSFPNINDALQLCITGVSAMWHRHTSMYGPGGVLPTDESLSPYKNILAYDELYDGPGNEFLFLRNRPIASVELVEVNGLPMQPSTGYANPGYGVHGSNKCLFIRNEAIYNRYLGTSMPGGFRYALGAVNRGFPSGIQNIHVQYHAGYTQIPDDVKYAVRKIVALNYRGRKWIGQKSQSMGMAGSMSYTDYDMDAECKKILEAYSPHVIVF